MRGLYAYGHPEKALQLPSPKRVGLVESRLLIEYAGTQVAKCEAEHGNGDADQRREEEGAREWTKVPS